MARQAPTPIQLRIRASRQILVYLVTVHALAVLALFIAALPLPGQVIGACALLASLAWQLRVHVVRHGSRAVTVLHWRSDGSWVLTDGRGQDHLFPQHDLVLASPALILLRLIRRDRKCRLVLAADSADAETLRQLRVRLRRQMVQPDDQGGPLTGR